LCRRVVIAGKEGSFVLKPKLRGGRNIAARAIGSVLEPLENRVLLSAPAGTVTFVMSINDDGFGDYTPNAFAIYAIDGTVNGTTVVPNAVAANGGRVDGGIDNFDLVIAGATSGSLNNDIGNGTTYATHSGRGTGQLMSSDYYLLTDSATESRGPSAVEAGFTFGPLYYDDGNVEVEAAQDTIGSPPSLEGVRNANPSTLIIFGLGQSAGDMRSFADSSTGNNPGLPSGTTFDGAAPASYPYAGPGTFTFQGNTYLSSLLVADGHYATGTPPTINTAASSVGLLAAYDEAFDTAAGGWMGAGSSTVVATITQTLTPSTPPATNTTVTSNNPSANYGQSVTFTATVAADNCNGQTGTVQFQIDGNDVGSPVPLSNYVATYTASTLTAGNHSITAIYSGDNNFASSTSSVFTQSVARNTTTTAVTSSNSASSFGQGVTFTATVASASDNGETGTVQFQVDGNDIGSPVPLSNNIATYTASTLTAGNHSITAVYSGDGNFVGSTSPSLTQDVAQLTPTITWANPAAITYGAALSSTQLDANASVPGTYSYRPISGTVPHAGTQMVSVVFTPGDTTDYTTAHASVDLIVNQAILTVKADNQSRDYGAANPMLTYSFSGFVNGDTPAVVSGAPGLSTTATPASTPNVYAITIDANTLTADDYRFNLVNGSLTISQATTVTAVTANNGSPTVGQPITFTATVTPASGGGRTGTVQFQIDGGDVGDPVAIIGDTASYTTAALTAGSHWIVAVYSGDNNFMGSTSPAFDMAIANLPPIPVAQVLAFTQQPSSTTAGDAIAPAITVSVEDSSGDVVTTDTSTVTLSIATGPAGATLGGTFSVAAVNGIATFGGIFIDTAGAFTLSAADGSLTGATSAPFTLSQPASFATLTGGALLVSGTPAADTIALTTSGSNLIVTLNGVSSSPILLSAINSIDVEAGAGNDYVSLGAGVPGSSVQGGPGDDTIIGGPGNDTLGGGAGNDSISGGPGDDSIKGGQGDDVLAGGKGNDTLFGSLGNDTLRGGLGDDSLSGGAGTNQLYGGQGDNIFYAVNGTADQIFAGGAANDSLIYSSGDNYILETGTLPPGNVTLV
jgi:hypothetical protein